MSDTMLFGVLRMPYEMAMGDELSRYQFWQRAQEAADRLEAAERATPPSPSTGIKPDPEHLVALALKGSLPEQQAGEVLRTAFAPSTSRAEKEAEQRSRLADRLTGRKSTPATADFDLIAQNDAPSTTWRVVSNVLHACRGEPNDGRWYLDVPYHTGISSVDDHQRFDSAREAIDAAIAATQTKESPN